MLRVKKKKTRKERKPIVDPFDIVMKTNYLNMAIMIRNMYTIYGYRTKRLAKLVEAHLALMAEVADGRITVDQAVKDCKDLTGIDVAKMIDELYVGGK